MAYKQLEPIALSSGGWESEISRNRGEDAFPIYRWQRGMCVAGPLYEVTDPFHGSSILVTF